MGFWHPVKLSLPMWIIGYSGLGMTITGIAVLIAALIMEAIK